MTLRNVGITEPYAHNGFFLTLKEITHFYNTRDVDPMWPGIVAMAWTSAISECHREVRAGSVIHSHAFSTGASTTTDEWSCAHVCLFILIR